MDGAKASIAEHPEMHDLSIRRFCARNSFRAVMRIICRNREIFHQSESSLLGVNLAIQTPNLLLRQLHFSSARIKDRRRNSILESVQRLIILGLAPRLAD